MSKYYNNRVIINSGSGSGHYIKSEENFNIVICRYENIQGTYIYILDNYFFFSDKILKYEDVKDFTYEDGLQILLQNISVEGFNEILTKRYKDGIHKGKLNFARKLRKLVRYE